MNYRKFLLAFLINSIVVASITALSIEARFTINDSPDLEKIQKDGIMKKLLYYLHYLPYYISSKLEILKPGNKVPEFINVLYIFLITFVISILIYHLLLIILGKNNMYAFYFGNL